MKVKGETMNKPTIFAISWTWDSNQEQKSGRATVKVNYPNMDQRQKTFNFVIGEEVEIYGYYYLASLDYRSNPKFD